MRVGVCSWSLGCESPAALARALDELGVSYVQLALDPIREGLWGLRETIDCLADVEIVSAMMTMAGEDYSTIESITRTGGVRPDETWEENVGRARQCVAIAQRMGIRLVTFHAGFFPPPTTTPHSGEVVAAAATGGGPTEMRDAPPQEGAEVRAGKMPAPPEGRERMIERVRTLANIYAAAGAGVALETGQESAGALVEVLDAIDRPDVGVNFDPANMILYGAGDPVLAAGVLASWVRQMHVKDARPSREPGVWGEEVPAGDGAVDFAALAGVLGGVDWVVEREAGEQRMRDLRRGVELASRVLGLNA